MTVYFITLVILLLLGILATKTGDKKNIYILITGCFILFVLAALRGSSVGADTKQYLQIFEYVRDLPLLKINTLSSYWWDKDGNIEITYKIYNKLLSYISYDSQTITVANSAILMLALFRLIKNQSKDYWLSLFLFYSLGFYQLALNLTPSFMSALIVLGGAKNFKKGKYFRFIIDILIALIFHTSAIYVAVGVIVCKFIKLTRKRLYVILIAAFIICFFGYSIFGGLLSGIVPSKYSSYLKVSRINIEQLLVLLIHILILMICLIYAKIKHCDKQIIEKNSFGLSIFIIEFIFYVFTLQNTMFSRGAFLFSPYLIICLPDLLNSIKNDTTSNGRLILAFDRKNYIINFQYLIVFICVAQYICRLFVNNIGTTMPYIPFW